MARTKRIADDERRSADPHVAEPEVLVFVPPATPEEEADAVRRWAKLADWLATLGALDS